MVEVDSLPFEDNLRELQNRLGISMFQPRLLLQALTHDSYFREAHPEWGGNERLEFLGDSVLGIVISHYLYDKFPEAPEGLLAQMKSYLVSTEFLEQKAREIELGRFILLGKGEDSSGGRERASVLTDTYEAVVGAIFLDSGMNCVEKLILPVFEPALEEVAQGKKNSKSLLQEHIQKHFKCLPLYTVIREEGPPHQKIFFVKVCFRGEVLGEGSGNSKKEAEKVAAEVALGNFKIYLERELSKEGKCHEEERT